MDFIHWDTIVTGLVSAIILWAVSRLTSTFESYRKESETWRGGTDGKLDALTDATQTTMRTTLLHYAEKYLTRGWITPEERASIYDMHQKYSALHANGYIDSYMEKVMALPDKEIEGYIDI